MTKLSWMRSWAAIALAVIVGTMGCSSPLTVTPLEGVFPLVAWEGKPLPVDLGSFKNSTCNDHVDNGTLVMNAASGTFSMGYEMRNCRNEVILGGTRMDGFFVQTGASVDYRTLCVDTGGCLHFAGEIRSDRILVSYSTPMEFSRIAN